MQLLQVTNAPLYLPYDTGFTPFGDPLSDIAITIAAPGVVTSPGYNAVLNDQVQFSTTGALPTGIVAGTIYYVVSPSTDTFQISATKGGSSITTSGSQSGTHTLHVLSDESFAITLPFKPGNSVIATGTSGLVLQGAPDLNSGYGNPGGPGTYVTIATVPAGLFVPALLSYDWIRVSTAATINLLQN